MSAEQPFQLYANKTGALYKIKNTMYNGKNINDIAKDMLKKSNDLGKVVLNILANTGIAGFQFDIIERQNINLENEITDHYVDSNRPVQDHIAQKPIIITLRGYTGNYMYSANILKTILSKIVPTMSLIQAFTPQLTKAAQQVKAAALKTLNKTLDEKTEQPQLLTYNAVDLFKIAQDLYKIKSPQTRAYLFLKALWWSKAIFTVETYWERFDNMVIQSIDIVSEDTIDITAFEVTLKQIQFTHSTVTNIEDAVGRRKQQSAPVVNKGSVKGISQGV